jgi:hypothetical protein
MQVKLEPRSWDPERRCVAQAKETGERCRRQPIPGGLVCVLHGGGAPQTIAAAKRRLLEGVEPALTRLLRFIETPPGLCNVCGRCRATSLHARRTLAIPVRTEHAAAAWPRFEERSAAPTFVEVDASIGGHDLGVQRLALRARERDLRFPH